MSAFCVQAVDRDHIGVQLRGSRKKLNLSTAESLSASTADSRILTTGDDSAYVVKTEGENAEIIEKISPVDVDSDSTSKSVVRDHSASSTSFLAKLQSSLVSSTKPSPKIAVGGAIVGIDGDKSNERKNVDLLSVLQVRSVDVSASSTPPEQCRKQSMEEWECPEDFKIRPMAAKNWRKIKKEGPDWGEGGMYENYRFSIPDGQGCLQDLTFFRAENRWSLSLIGEQELESAKGEPEIVIHSEPSRIVLRELYVADKPLMPRVSGGNFVRALTKCATKFEHSITLTDDSDLTTVLVYKTGEAFYERYGFIREDASKQDNQCGPQTKISSGKLWGFLLCAVDGTGQSNLDSWRKDEQGEQVKKVIAVLDAKQTELGSWKCDDRKSVIPSDGNEDINSLRKEVTVREWFGSTFEGLEVSPGDLLEARGDKIAHVMKMKIFKWILADSVPFVTGCYFPGSRTYRYDPPH